MDRFIFKQGKSEDLDLVKSLWEKLNQLHLESSLYFKDRYESMSWNNRKQSMIAKSKEVHLEYAFDSMCDKIIGYCISSVEKDGKIGEIDFINDLTFIRCILSFNENKNDLLITCFH
jgi:diamine N-acetyltransferase